MWTSEVVTGSGRSKLPLIAPYLGAYLRLILRRLRFARDIQITLLPHNKTNQSSPETDLPKLSGPYDDTQTYRTCSNVPYRHAHTHATVQTTTDAAAARPVIWHPCTPHAGRLGASRARRWQRDADGQLRTLLASLPATANECCSLSWQTSASPWAWPGGQRRERRRSGEHLQLSAASSGGGGTSPRRSGRREFYGVRPYLRLIFVVLLLLGTACHRAPKPEASDRFFC